MIAVRALLGTLAVGEYLAGAIITVMLASGRMLEARAGARAQRDLRALVDRAPRTVHRYLEGTLTEPALSDVQPWDLLLVRPGEVLPVDGLAGATVLLLDKTGTLTEGRPTVAEVIIAGDMQADELLRTAASLEQVSPHVLAAAVVRGARVRGAEVRRVHQFLAEELLPHEEAEDTALYPAVAAELGGTDPTGAMSRGHVEIAHHLHRLGRLLDQLPDVGPDEDDLMEMRRLLYGLHAILRLHFAQEEQSYLSLVGPEPAPGPA